MKSMKIGLYSPYIPRHFGGGEKHLLTSAWYLSQNHEVEVLIPTNAPPEKDWRKRYETLFGLDLQRVRFLPSPLADRTASPLDTWLLTRKYDAFVYLTDGSLFFSGAKRNILHIQIPFTVSKDTFLERLKLKNWSIKNANSRFTQAVVESAWKTSIPFLHYPYVRLSEKTLPLPKKHSDIIAVGRFIAPGHASHSKGQEVLIRAFAEAREKKQLASSELHLVGTIEPGTEAQRFVEELQRQAAGLPVHFWFDLPQTKLDALYDRCSLFWHAAGWEIDDQQHPEKVEHFGMTTIEAMAHQCIPFVLPKGGSKEIVTEDKDGFFFATEQELIEKSISVLRSPAQQKQIGSAALQRAGDFSLDRFCRTLETMVEGEPV